MFDPDIMLPRFIINNDVVSENYKITIMADVSKF